MATRIAPILPVTDLTVALEHYRRLGFSVRAYHKGGYGFATLGPVEIHLGVVGAQQGLDASLGVPVR